MADVQIYLAGYINNQTVPPLIQMVTERVGKGARSILLALSSPGGNVFWGVTAHNLLRGLGVEIITHNIGRVDSVAAVIYCAGTRRLCMPDAKFLIHGVSSQFANENLSEKGLRSRLTDLEQDRDTIASILATGTGRPVGEVKSDMFNEKIMNAEEAQAYGFVTEITTQVFDPSQEIVQIILP